MATPKRILIVEDNDDYRYLLGVFLNREGYDIVEATTGLEAIEQAHATHPDLIIMDLGLPGITGD
jgi:CheY-like chemotaxis protein